MEVPQAVREAKQRRLELQLKQKQAEQQKGTAWWLEDQKPDKVFGDCWEEPRWKWNMRLVGEMAPSGTAWTYPLNDESRRAFAGFLPDALTEEQCKEFFDKIRDGTTWKQPTNQWGTLPRKTAWMVKKGCECTYRYGDLQVEPQEFPPWMVELLEVAMPLCGMADKTVWPDSCNLNLYEDGGMSVGWHSDDESLFQGKFRDITIISLSLGVKRKFELRLNWPEAKENPLKEVMLGAGDLMTMEGMVQKHFQHRVPKEDNIQGPRINLTWRWVLKHQPQCPCQRLRNKSW